MQVWLLRIKWQYYQDKKSFIKTAIVYIFTIVCLSTIILMNHKIFEIIKYIDEKNDTYGIIGVLLSGILSGLVAIFTIGLTTFINNMNFKKELKQRNKELKQNEALILKELDLANKKYKNELNLRKYEKLFEEWSKLKLFDKLTTILTEQDLNHDNIKMVHASINSKTLTNSDIYKDIGILKNIANGLDVKEFKLQVNDIIVNKLYINLNNYKNIDLVSIYDDKCDVIYMCDINYLLTNIIINPIEFNEDECFNFEKNKNLQYSLLNLLNNEELYCYLMSKEKELDLNLNYLFGKKLYDKEYRRIEIEYNMFFYYDDEYKDQYKIKVKLMIDYLNKCLGFICFWVSTFVTEFYLEPNYEKYLIFLNFIKSTQSLTKDLYNMYFDVDHTNGISENTKFIIFNKSESINEFTVADALLLIERDKIKKIVEMNFELQKKYAECLSIKD